MITRDGKKLEVFKPSAIHIHQSKYKLRKSVGVYFPYGSEHWFMGEYVIPVRDVFFFRSMFKVISSK